MANELKHGSVGTELTQAEWEGIGTHVLESQAAGDIVYASSSSQLRRLAKGTDTHVLILSSGVPAWSATTGITTVGTIATGVWQGTDVGVAYGGTGVSTLTDGGVLLGSGTGAITAMSVLTDGQMIVGNGSTDPVAESGATLRTSIGVGTGDSPTFTAVTLSNGQIVFPATQVASAGANTLDGYEEGTFTPKIADNTGGNGSSEGQGYATNVGRYTKIGNRVWYTGRIKITEYGTMTTSGPALIVGMPFTSSSAANSNGVVSFGYCDSLQLGNASESLTGFMSVNNTYMDIYVWDATDGPNVLTLAVMSDDDDNADLMFSGSYEV